MILSTLRKIAVAAVLVMLTVAGTNAETIKTVGATGADYTSIGAAITAINGGGGIADAYVLELQPDYAPGGETYPLTLPAITGASATNTFTIRPAATCTTAIVLTTASGASGSGTILFSSATYYILDGRPGGTGTNRYIQVINTGTAATGIAAIMFQGGSNNTVKYCYAKANNQNSSSNLAGVINIGNGTSGSTSNTIDNCEIDGGSTANIGINVNGSTSSSASNNITNNRIHDFNTAAQTWGIRCGSTTSTTTITGNHIYRTVSTAVSTSAINYGIQASATSSTGYVISDNYIGGNSAFCNGLWTVATSTYRLFVIEVSVGTAVTTSIQGNKICGFDITTSFTTAGSSAFLGISIANGAVDCGTTTGNTIGSTAGNDSIKVKTTASTGSGILWVGINVAAIATVNIKNNTIAGITVDGNSTTNSIHLYPISASGAAGTLTLTLDNNTIGSTLANSIKHQNSSYTTGVTNIHAIRIAPATSANVSATITSNTIQNISYNSSSGKGQVVGIYGANTSSSTIFGNYTFTGNTIKTLINTSVNTGTTSSSALMGILDIVSNGGSGSATAHSISGNQIYDLNMSNNGANAHSVIGIYCNLPAAALTHIIAKNSIKQLYMASTSASSVIYGVYVSHSTNTSNFSNNMIALGYDASGTSLTVGYGLSGILDNVGTNNYYYNTVVVGGTGVANATNTYAFNSSVTTNTRNYINNIFVNNRSNGAGTGKHYAVKYGGTTVYPSGLSANNNLFYAGGTGGVLGFYNSADRTSLSAWVTATGRDFNSVSAPVSFISISDVHIDTTSATCWYVLGQAAPLSSYADEYDRTSVRNTTMAAGMNCIGADQFTTNTSPAAASVTGTIADGGSTTYEHAGRTVASITWHANSGSLPSAANITYYPGQVPPGASTAYGYGYWVLSVTGGSYNYNYDLTMNYDSAAVRSLTEASMKLYVDLNQLSSSTVSTAFRARTLSITGITHSAGTYALGDNTTPLPVELSSLNAAVRGSTVTVKWETATEQNAASFTVERKTAAGSWVSAGTVKAAGNSNSPRTYSFADRNLAAGSYQYRLKMVDNDGSFTYSASVNAEVGVPAEFSLSQNYPNPFNPATNVEFALPMESKVTLEVFNVAGEKVLTVLNGTMRAGFHSASINGSGLNSGIYFYRLSAGSFVQTRKMMLVK